MRRVPGGWVLVLGIALAGLARADTITGRVIGVADGDTITILEGKQSRKIRLAGIDAPEKAQAFGVRSKAHLADLVFGKTVQVEWTKMDRYGRVVGKVTVNGRDANLEQIRAGLVWWYRRYANEQALADRVEYSAAEVEAKGLKIGLWGDANPVPPWEWRRAKRTKGE